MIHDKQLNTFPEHHINRDKLKPSKNVKVELVWKISIVILFTRRQFCPNIVEPYDAYESSDKASSFSLGREGRIKLYTFIKGLGALMFVRFYEIIWPTF